MITPSLRVMFIGDRGLEFDEGFSFARLTSSSMYQTQNAANKRKPVPVRSIRSEEYERVMLSHGHAATIALA